MAIRWLILLVALIALLAGADAGAARLAADAEPAASQAVPGPGKNIPVFKSMGINRPFQAEIITEVLQDKVGFLWIGTREGLYLYDGQRFRKFQHEVQTPDSISSNGIRGLLEDSRGRLWINTISGGLNLLDRSTWRFRSWRHDPANPDSLSHDGVFVLAQAPGDKLWVGTQAGLDLFDPETGRFKHTILATGGEFVMTLLVDRSGRLWVGTLGQGVFRQNEDHSGFDPVRASGSGESLDVFSLAQDAGGRIWVGTRERLYSFDAAQDRLVDPGLSPAAAAGGLENVTDLKPTPDGGLWIGTFGVGLYRLAPHARDLVKVPLGPEGPGALHIDAGALELGRDGSLFVGTFGAGLLRSNPGGLRLRAWRAGADGQPGLSFEDVYALLDDPSPAGGASGLLVGSFGGGIDRIAAATGAVAHVPLPQPEGIQARLSGVLDLIRDRDGVIWAATSDGVYRWDMARRQFHTYRPDQATGPSAAPGYSYALLQDREGRVWVGTGGGGLYLYRQASDDFENFRPDAGDPRSLSDDFVTVMIEDRRGRLWVGMRSGGISVCRFGVRLDCDHIGAGDGTAQVSHDHITSLLETGDGAIWVGMAGGGLNRITLDGAGKVASVRRWSRDDGLVDDNVMALVRAPDGALWLSTHGGITRLDPASGRLDNITPTDGLPTAVFNPKAALLHNGRLFFGSAKGVVALDPSQKLHHGPPPPTVIEGISGLAPEELPSVPAWQVDALQVPWRRPFSLEFAVLGYGGGQTEFQYRLGEGDPWTSLGDRGQLTLHALSPGHHLLQVRGRQDGSAWTRTQPLQLDIVPPWWRRTAVQAAGMALLLGLLFGGFYWRMRELQGRNRELQRVHAQREQAFAEANTSRDRLQDAFASLRRMTMRLEAAKEEERKHIARELHDEFGQALTAAKINLRLALVDAERKDAEGRIDDTIGLVERLITQVRALSLDLRPPLLDELGLVPALEGYLQAVSERSGIPIRTDLARQLPKTGPEREIAVFRIVQEAVTNALRHADAKGLEVAVQAAEADAIHIRIHDDGRGFDSAAAMSEGAGGFGLFGMRERVHDLGGQWTLDSQPGQGTTVTASIPSRQARLATASSPNPDGGTDARRTG